MLSTAPHRNRARALSQSSKDTADRPQHCFRDVTSIHISKCDGHICTCIVQIDPVLVASCQCTQQREY